MKQHGKREKENGEITVTFYEGTLIHSSFKANIKYYYSLINSKGGKAWFSPVSEITVAINLSLSSPST